MRSIFGRGSPMFRLREANHAKRGNFVNRAAQVGLQGGFKRGDGELIDTQRAKEWIAADAFDDFFFPRDNSSLRASQQLISAEGND